MNTATMSNRTLTLLISAGLTMLLSVTLGATPVAPVGPGTARQVPLDSLPDGALAHLTAAPEAGTPPGHVRYFVVLKGGGDPDFKAFGAKVEQAWKNRRLVTLPGPAVEALARHDRVLFMQQITRTGRAEGLPERASSGEALRLEGAEVFSETTLGAYQYDGSGNITAIGNDAYRYDRVNRLTQSTTWADGQAKNEAYAYDPYGNMTSKTPSGPSLETNPITNQLTTMSYDEAGNVKVHGAESFRWSSAGDLKGWNGTAGQFKEYVYTPDSERIGVAHYYQGWSWTIRDFSGKVIREYESAIYDPWGEMGQAWLWNEDFVHANGKLLGGEREPELGGRRHYHVDHLGSTRMVSTWDGYRLTEHKYLPFGVEATKLLQEKSVNFDHESKLKYTGHERDYLGGELVENTNYLDYMHARYFNPNFARFLSVDPKLDLKRATRVPQGWNRYAYVENNPIKAVDPDGRALDIVVDAAFVVADVSDISAKYIAGDPVGWRDWGALGADVLGAAIPFATGLGKFLKFATEAKHVVGFAEGTAHTALTADRLQHASRHLTEAGILGNWSKATGEKFIKIATNILEKPQATFDTSLRGNAAVKGFIGTVDGKTVAVLVYKDGKDAGKVATSFVPSAEQLLEWGVK
jgi:RHS repeat-associated protein